MIRLIILAIGVFLAWVLFVSDFSKQKKIIICVGSLLICIAGLWYEQAGQTPKEGRIAIDEIEDCGVSAQFSYRTNYDIEFCLRNTSLNATAKRIAMSFVALQCPDGNCEEIQSISKEIQLSLEPNTIGNFKENLNFDKVNASMQPLVWIAKVDSVKAIN